LFGENKLAATAANQTIEYIRKFHRYIGISKTPANVVSIVCVATATSHSWNAARFVPSVHCVQPGAKATLGHQHINMVWKSVFFSFGAWASFVVGRWHPLLALENHADFCVRPPHGAAALALALDNNVKRLWNAYGG
jgi:hypothetical protein